MAEKKKLRLLTCQDFDLLLYEKVPVDVSVFDGIRKCDSVQELSKIVKENPMLAAEILRYANSALFSPAKKVTSLETALALIGLEQARLILLTSLFFSLGSANGGVREIIERSKKASERALELCREYGFDREMTARTATFALLQDIGEIVKAVNPEVEILLDHAKVGKLLLRCLDLPKEVQRAVEFHESILSAPEITPELAIVFLTAKEIKGEDLTEEEQKAVREALEKVRQSV